MCWWPIRLICAACGSPAACLICLALALELSIFLASCHTLLARNFSRSTLPSLISLDTNSSSFIKNQNISRCKILAVSGGYLARLTWACTTLYCLSTLQFHCLKLVNRSNWALTSLDYGLQNSSNLSHIVSNLGSYLSKFHDTYWSIPESPTPYYYFLALLFLWEGSKLTLKYIFAF